MVRKNNSMITMSYADKRNITVKFNDKSFLPVRCKNPTCHFHRFDLLLFPGDLKNKKYDWLRLHTEPMNSVTWKVVLQNKISYGYHQVFECKNPGCQQENVLKAAILLRIRRHIYEYAEQKRVRKIIHTIRDEKLRTEKWRKYSLENEVHDRDNTSRLRTFEDGLKSLESKLLVYQ